MKFSFPGVESKTPPEGGNDIATTDQVTVPGITIQWLSSKSRYETVGATEVWPHL